MLNQRLETLLCVYETLNFTKASETLNLTQPAVSQHIKALENEFKCKIFIRGEKSLKVTPEGEIVVKYAKRIQNLFNTIPSALRDYRNNARHIRIGVTQTAELGQLSSMLAKYCLENDGIHITLISDTINNLYVKLKNYEVDMIIVEGKKQDSNFNSILLDTDCLILAVANENPLSKKSVVTMEELKKEKLILRLPESGTRALFEAHLKSVNESLDSFDVILEVDHIATIKDLVHQNFGVSVLAKSVCYNDVQKNKFAIVSIENLSMIRDINLIYHKDFEAYDIINQIVNLYQEMVRHQ
ncbi:MAG: LysR family transcriptional regulator [Clostridia bacterium]|nr:LysR family transcriptional regulator [Clostridia bacterium]